MSQDFSDPYQQKPLHDPYQQQPQRSSSTWIWILVAAIVGLPSLACAGLCAGGYFVIGKASEMLTMNPPMEMARERMANRPAIADRLGLPLESGVPNPFHYRDNNDRGSANFTYTIKGAKASADVQLEAVKSGGVWDLRKLTVRFRDGEVFELADKAPQPDDQDEGEVQPPPVEPIIEDPDETGEPDKASPVQ